MKLIRSEINNFRLLKELVLDFSCDEKKNLTVIRAANETGKTTCKAALLWGIFGNRALPDNGRRYPLFPSDMKETTKNVEVSVQIDFETEQIVMIGRGSHELQTKRYRLKRSCIEYPTGGGEIVRREGETVILFEQKAEGTERVLDSNVDSVIESSIPVALKDVYFTDGDSAMSFIEAAATTGVKRKRVSGAIEALLGLETLKRTSSRLEKSARNFSSKIDSTDYKTELEKLNDRIGGWGDDVEGWEDERKTLEDEIREGSTELSSIRRKIDEALKLGDKEKLANEMKKCTKNILRAEDSSKRAADESSILLNSPDLSAAIISPLALKGLKFLSNLSDKKELPKVSIPILEELLDRDVCFCGSDLSNLSEKGIEGRESVQRSIDASRKGDKVQEAGTALFYAVRSETFGSERGLQWVGSYASRNQDYSEARSSLKSEQKRRILLKAEIDSIKNSSLESFRQIETSLEDKLSSSRITLGQRESSIKDAQERRADAEKERQTIEKRLNKTDTSSDKLRLSRTAQRIFNQISDRLKKEELNKVSDHMNRIFLEMIGSNPEENDFTLITRTELTEDYDILVYGPNGHELNPDQDLNGASRRAITLAFILALTKVSQVEAPNVIDTPLGMMAGFVKRSVLRRTVSEGSQVILFLTQDEIAGVEDIIDDVAGTIYTLTNPAHYPRMLVHEPTTLDARVVRCECDHRSECSICERVSASATT